MRATWMKLGWCVVLLGTACGPGTAEMTDPEALPEEAVTSDAELVSLSPVVKGSGLKWLAASADKSQVLYRTAQDGNGCAALGLLQPASKTFKLVSAAGAYCTSFDRKVAMTEDGAKVAFWSWDAAKSIHQLVVLDTATQQTTPVAEHPGEEATSELSALFFSPDGAKLLFANLQPGTVQQYESFAFFPGTRKTVKLASNLALVDPRFSSDGAQVLLLADGMGLRKLVRWDFATAKATELAQGSDWTTHLSPDGKSFVTRVNCEDDPSTGKSLCDLLAGDFTGPPEVIDSDVTQVAGFTPKDGTFVYLAQGELRFWTAATGALALQDVTGLCWVGFGPDGKKLAFLAACATQSDWEGQTGTLYSLPLSGTTLGALRKVDTRVQTSQAPTFSADNAKLAYVKPGGKTSELYVSLEAKSTPDRLGAETYGGYFDGMTGSYLFSADSKKLYFLQATSWYSPLCPWSRCGYIDLKSRDVSSKYGSTRTAIGGSAYTLNRFTGLSGGVEAFSTGKNFLAVSTARSVVQYLNVLDLNKGSLIASRAVSGLGSEILVADGFVVVRDERGLSVGSYK